MTDTTKQYSDMTDTTLTDLALSLRASMHENGSLLRKFEYLREAAGLNGINPFYSRYNAACARLDTVIDAMTQRSLCIPDKAQKFDIRFNLAEATWNIPMSVYALGSAELIFGFPRNTDASMFGAWIEEYVQPILERIKSGYTLDVVHCCDGYPMQCTRFDRDADKAFCELCDVMVAHGGTLQRIS